MLSVKTAMLIAASGSDVKARPLPPYHGGKRRDRCHCLCTSNEPDEWHEQKRTPPPIVETIQATNPEPARSG